MRLSLWHFGAILVLLFAAGPLSAADWGKAQAVTVRTTEYGFAPAHLAFQRGVAYRLHLENRGKELHEFRAPEFFASVEVGNPQALNADRSEIVLHPGQKQDVYFVPKRAGHFPLICPDHDWAGMTGSITVK